MKQNIFNNLSKEDIIVVRLFLLEFGNAEVRRFRLSFPYENAVLKGNISKGYLAEGRLLWNLMNKIDRQLESIETFEVWDALHHFFLSRDSEDTAYPEHFRIVEQKPIGKFFSACADKDMLDMYRLPQLEAQNQTLYDLRVGLFYKSAGNVHEALPSLRCSWGKYKACYQGFLEKTGNALLERIRAFKKGETVTPLEIEVPVELMLIEEESPGFHLVECLIESPDKAEADENPSDILTEVEQITGDVLFGRGEMSLFYEFGLLDPWNAGFQRNPYLLKLRQIVEGKGLVRSPLDAQALERSTYSTSIGLVRNEISSVLDEIEKDLPKDYPITKRVAKETKTYILEAIMQEQVTGYIDSSITKLSNAVEREMKEHVAQKLKKNLSLLRKEEIKHLKLDRFQKDGRGKYTLKIEHLLNILRKNRYKKVLLDFNPRLQNYSWKNIDKLRVGRTWAAHDAPNTRKPDYKKIKNLILNPDKGLLAIICQEKISI